MRLWLVSRPVLFVEAQLVESLVYGHLHSVCLSTVDDHLSDRLSSRRPFFQEHHTGD